MTSTPPDVWLVRHGQTEWSRDGRHTSTTDLPLLPEGEEDARALAGRLAAVDFALVLTSPRQRAARTAELAGFPDAERSADLVEWDYGDYEGISTVEIRKSVPGWTVWTEFTPGGETAGDVCTRLDRVIARARAAEGPVLLFGHGHSLRALTARWVGLPVREGRVFHLNTGSVSVLSQDREIPVVLHWNA